MNVKDMIHDTYLVVLDYNYHRLFRDYHDDIQFDV